MADMYSKVVIDQTARPLRLALLVDPADVETVRTAIGICTVQWGGVFNPLIPVFKRRPDWWNPPIRKVSGPPTATEAAENTIRSWDPDFLVDCRKADRNSRPLDASIERLSPDDLLSGDGFLASKAGVSTALLYEHFHRRVFQFMRSGGPRPVLPGARGAMADLVDTCFGRFPDAQMERRYLSALGAERLPVSVGSLFQTQALRGVDDETLLWPLSVGAEGLMVYPGLPGLDEQVFFLLDPASPIDLIDFWNLRAAGHRVMPVPIEWADEVAGLWNDSWAARSRTPIDASVAGGRRLDGDAIRSLHSALEEAGGSVFINAWLTPWGEGMDGAQRRPLLVSAEKRDEVRVDGGRVSFDLASPNILDEDLQRRAASWANVIRIGFGGPDAAEAFPPPLGEVGELLNSWDQLSVAAREEGLVCVSGTLDRRANWRLPSGAEVFAHFARGLGFTPRTSEPGQVSREIVRRLGGLIGVGVLRHPSLVEALNKAVRSESRSVQRSEIWSAVMQARGSEARAAHLLKVLLERRVIDAGVTIQCPTCAKSNWYGPADMGLQLQCERCLNDFPFPGHDPPHRDQWAYRPRGGFASPGYAMGSYSALLSLRLLSGSMDRVSWAPSTSLDSSTEVDFAMWLQRAPVLSAEPSKWSLLLGECKSHGEFLDQDFERMKRVRAAFPEAILVFASLRETLCQREIAALTAFARPADRATASHHPDVMILTALELFSDHLPGAWHDVGGRAAELAPEHFIGPRPECERLADLTQQIHLGVESFESWRYASST